ncbi:MAG: CBS domain-containing protein [Deltaproteobacteria bacterium]|nr:CBS domain-containing protein [Deltaproteobacteria bacterium]
MASGVQGSDFMSALLVSSIMTPDVETLFEDETMDLARTIMTLARIRHLPVVDRAEQLVGLVTHRDLLRTSATALRQGKSEAQVRVAEIMTRGVRTVSSSTTAFVAGQMLLEHKLGCLPVVDEKRLVGIVTEADFVSLALKHLADTGA